MYHLHRKTLAALKVKPLVTHVSHADVSLIATIHLLNEYFATSPGHANVEEQALQFYMLNHANSLLLGKFDSDEVLSDEAYTIGANYVHISNKITLRMVYYTLLIITRESRHLHKSNSFHTELEKKYGSVFYKWFTEIPGGSDAAASYLRKNLLEMPIGKYTTALTDIFNNGKFSGGYGGKPWGNIADTLRKLVHGEISPEIFTDTAWTLAHNNGPMFNKGMLYNHYTNDIYKILDVQRSGQVPQLIAEGKISGISDAVKKHYDICSKFFPKEFGGHVDWHLVENLGAMHKYTNEKKAQVDKYGKSPFADGATSVSEKTKFYVTGTEYAFITQRKKAA